MDYHYLEVISDLVDGEVSDCNVLWDRRDFFFKDILLSEVIVYNYFRSITNRFSYNCIVTFGTGVELLSIEQFSSLLIPIVVLVSSLTLY